MQSKKSLQKAMTCLGMTYVLGHQYETSNPEFQVMRPSVVFAAMGAFIVPVVVVVAMNWDQIQSMDAVSYDNKILYFYSPS